MHSFQVRFLGSGDAFGSGGRLQPCIYVQAAAERFLVDCGATAQIALRHHAIDANAIGVILISHLHGDHFGGLPFFILAGQLVSKRTAPLVIAGPPGTGQKVAALMEIMFPGSSTAPRKFTVDIVEMTAGKPSRIGALTVTPYPVAHTTADQSFALRIECGRRIIAYSGDGEWSESLAEAGRGADLLIAEAYYYDKKIKYHLDYQTLQEHLDAIRPRRLILTHMSDDMLGRLDQLDCEWAEDGKTIDL